MISREMLRYRLEMIRIGYRPDRRTITDIIESHIEAHDEMDRLRAAADPFYMAVPPFIPPRNDEEPF